MYLHSLNADTRKNFTIPHYMRSDIIFPNLLNKFYWSDLFCVWKNFRKNINTNFQFSFYKVKTSIYKLLDFLVNIYYYLLFLKNLVVIIIIIL